ncbi:Ger(x)C family spore germination protein [Ornithinibacillus xuwenensis]|uniref:Ger(X)C family spore germination protein n=1 Tax=Ornithinibacillus xuwenensis TaxID=3144668 RepID=A0ABU9XIF1_9BACI
MRRYLFILYLIPVIFLSSCVQTQQLEQLGIIASRGVDLTDNNEVEITMAVLQFEADSQDYTKVITGKSHSIKGAVDEADKRSNKTIVGGKLELEIYGKSVAEKGINPYLDTLRRDATIPDTMLLAVSETTGKEIIDTQESGLSTNIGEFLHGLVQTGIQTKLFPSVSLQQLSTIINNEGIDPILPIIGLDEGVPKIKGIALFKNDKLVGEVPIEEEKLFMLIQGTVRGQLFEVQLPTEALSDYIKDESSGDSEENFTTTFLIEHGTGDIKLKNKEKLQFDTNIDIELNLMEISKKYDLEKEKAIQDLEKEVEKEVKKRYEKILKQLKELNSDAFGYGVIYRINNKDGKLTKKEWDKLFPKIESKFTVNVDIIRHGTVNK